MSKIGKVIQLVLVKLLIVKQCGKYPNGYYIMNGFNRKNPVALLMAFILCFFLSFIDYFDSFVDNWELIMEEKD